jgi:hypothetical protein
VTCRPVARQRLGKHISATTNTQATVGIISVAMQYAVNIIEEEVFSVWFAYCRTTDVFCMDPSRDYISDTEQSAAEGE